jgi:nucleoside-diphosphate-sugar epimerase
MHIAVTGSTGRIGRAIVEMALAQGHSVVGLDRLRPEAGSEHPNFTFHQLEMTEYHGVENALRGCDGLIHMAAIPAPGYHPDPWVHNGNVVGSYNALRAAAEVGIRRICQASSVNATGSAYSRWPRYDYFPLDELHPTYNEDPYSLSKWICEIQADSFARLYADMTLASLRFHGVFHERPFGGPNERRRDSISAKALWGWVSFEACARASLQALTAGYTGHEVFYIVAPNTTMQTPSLALAEELFPEVPITGDLSGDNGFYNCAKAERLLGWRHDPGAAPG